MYTQFAAEKSICVVTLVDSFAKSFESARLENKQREEDQQKKTSKKKRKKIKKKKASTSSKTKGLMNTPKLSEGGEEITAEREEDVDETQDVLDKLFPVKDEEGVESASKNEGDEEDDEKKAAKKVKKVKKVKKIKKKKKKADDGDDGGDGGGGDDEDTTGKDD